MFTDGEPIPIHEADPLVDLAARHRFIAKILLFGTLGLLVAVLLIPAVAPASLVALSLWATVAALFLVGFALVISLVKLKTAVALPDGPPLARPDPQPLDFDAPWNEEAAG